MWRSVKQMQILAALLLLVGLMISRFGSVTLQKIVIPIYLLSLAASLTSLSLRRKLVKK